MTSPPQEYNSESAPAPVASPTPAEIPARNRAAASIRWGVTGLFVGSAAAALAAIGVAIALFQASALSRRQTEQTKLLADQVAEIVALQFMNEAVQSPEGTTGNETNDQRYRRLVALIPKGSGLEVVRTTRASAPWSRPLPSPLQGWAVQSTEAFQTSQRRAVLVQTFAYACITILALLTLFLAMRLLMRVVRREVALAELKSNFVADVSHELKTPLAMIKLFAETLQSGRVADDEKRREYYGIISRESTRLTTLINNILDFARIEAGRRQYTLQPTDLAAVVRETYETYREELDRHQFEHSLHVASPLPTVQADRDAVTQILINLMSNAIKYSADERVLSIDLKPDTIRGRRGVQITVEDCGIGIRPEDRARVFEGFFRAADGRVLRQGGTGLGLTLVKHIVEAHGGTLEIEPRLVKGTAFRIFLPSSP